MGLYTSTEIKDQTGYFLISQRLDCSRRCGKMNKIGKERPTKAHTLSIFTHRGCLEHKLY